MKKVALSLLTAVALATPALAADLKMLTKAPPPPPPSPWDFAFGDAIMTDYMWRGITQSAHKPSVAAYFEPRYNFNNNLQAYVGLSGESIDFPNRAAAEVDFYGGIRPTFDKLALDFGAWLYYYPGGQCFSAGTFQPGTLTGNAACNAFSSGGNWQLGALPNGNAAKAWASFYEVYGKATYTISDSWSVGAQVYYSPSVSNTGANGTYAAGTIKFTAPAGMPLPKDVGFYASADGGYWWLGTSDAFYGTAAFPNGIKYTSFANLDVGIGFTWKVFTLDFRYYTTNLNKGDCNAFTSDHTTFTGGATTVINPPNLLPTGLSSNWCSSTFVAKLSSDLTLANLK